MILWTIVSNSSRYDKRRHIYSIHLVDRDENVLHLNKINVNKLKGLRIKPNNNQIVIAYECKSQRFGIETGYIQYCSFSFWLISDRGTPITDVNCKWIENIYITPPHTTPPPSRPKKSGSGKSASAEPRGRLGPMHQWGPQNKRHSLGHAHSGDAVVIQT